MCNQMLYLMDYAVNSFVYAFDDADGSLERIPWGMFEQCLDQGLKFEGVSVFNRNKVRMHRAAPVQARVVIQPDCKMIVDVEAIQISAEAVNGANVALQGYAHLGSTSGVDPLTRQVWGGLLSSPNVMFKLDSDPATFVNRLQKSGKGDCKVTIRLPSLNLQMPNVCFRASEKGVYLINKNVSENQLWRVYFSTGRCECKLKMPNQSDVCLDTVVGASSWGLRVSDIWKTIYGMGY